MDIDEVEHEEPLSEEELEQMEDDNESYLQQKDYEHSQI